MHATFSPVTAPAGGWQESKDGREAAHISVRRFPVTPAAFLLSAARILKNAQPLRALLSKS
jgi:hypothetical protein